MIGRLSKDLYSIECEVLLFLHCLFSLLLFQLNLFWKTIIFVDLMIRTLLAMMVQNREVVVQVVALVVVQEVALVVVQVVVLEVAGMNRVGSTGGKLGEMPISLKKVVVLERMVIMVVITITHCTTQQQSVRELWM